MPAGVVTVTSTASGAGAAGITTVTAVALAERTWASSPGPKCTADTVARLDPDTVRVPPPWTGPWLELSPVTTGQPPAGWRALSRAATFGDPHPVAMS